MFTIPNNQAIQTWLLGCGVAIALAAECPQAFSQAPTPTPAVKISALDDISFGAFTGDSDLSAEDPICVFNNQSTNFRITFYTSGDSFALTHGAQAVPFYVRFKVGNGGYTSMTHNVATEFSGANTVSSNCNSSPNATYEIKMLKQELLSVRPGNYSTTLYILLEPAI